MIRVLEFLGKPIFWLAYILLLTGVKLYTAIRISIIKVNKFFQVTKIVLFRLTNRQGRRRATFLAPLAVLGSIIATLLISGVLFYQLILKDLPTPQQLVRERPAVSTKIYDRNGYLLYKIYQNENRSIIPLTDIPPHVIQATVAIEDASFYGHAGFSIRGIIRALRKNATSDSIQGGSTITQQLVKNALLSSEKTFTRKARELWLSLLVEYYFTKDEILSMYLNEVGYGGTAYGVEEAAQQYFGKSVREVNLAEAALLAGLPQSPTVYSPFGASPELAVTRQHHVLSRMVEEGMITPEAYAEAITTTLVFASPKTDITAPHFVMWVRDQLVREFGEEAVTHNGLEVITTLDARIQWQAEAAVKQELARLTGMKVSNGAAMVTNPKTGEILAMVGSADYFDTKRDGQVNVALRARQPGSSIKPLTYALGLANRYITPATLIADVPTVYATAGSPPYAPQNYDGRFHGNVSVRSALANSYNIPAVKMLAQVGVSNLVDFARNMGITTWNEPDRYGLALTLGGGEIRMIDMAEAYGVFAYGGKRVPLTPFIRVTDPTTSQRHEYVCGKKTWPIMAPMQQKQNCEGKTVLDPGVAFLISDILADNEARTPAFGPRSVLLIPDQQVAVKTGTTNDLRDNWTFGYTKDYLVATWVGNNDNSRMSNVASGITGASPIWHNIMASLPLHQAAHRFVAPATVVSAPRCLSMTPAGCGSCVPAKSEYYLQGTEPQQDCVRPSPESPTINTENPRDKLLDGITDIFQRKPTGRDLKKREKPGR